MAEQLKDKDMIRGVIVNADEYKSDDIISQDKIEEVWVNLNNLKSAVELLKEKEKDIEGHFERRSYKLDVAMVKEIFRRFRESIDQAFLGINLNKK